MGELELFRARSRAATALFFVFFSVIALRALQLAVISRERFLRAGERIAQKSGSIPARRGCLLDKNKTPLVWNERHFELWSTLPPGADLTEHQRQTLQKIFPGETLPILPGNAAPLRFRLRAKEIEQLEPLIRLGLPAEDPRQDDAGRRRFAESPGSGRDRQKRRRPLRLGTPI